VSALHLMKECPPPFPTLIFILDLFYSLPIEEPSLGIFQSSCLLPAYSRLTAAEGRREKALPSFFTLGRFSLYIFEFPPVHDFPFQVFFLHLLLFFLDLVFFFPTRHWADTFPSLLVKLVFVRLTVFFIWSPKLRSPFPASSLFLVRGPGSFDIVKRTLFLGRPPLLVTWSPP